MKKVKVLLLSWLVLATAIPVMAAISGDKETDYVENVGTTIYVKTEPFLDYGWNGQDIHNYADILGWSKDIIGEKEEDGRYSFDFINYWYLGARVHLAFFFYDEYGEMVYSQDFYCEKYYHVLIDGIPTCLVYDCALDYGNPILKGVDRTDGGCGKTETPTPIKTPTMTATLTKTPMPTKTLTVTPTITQTASFTATATATRTATLTATPEPTPYYYLDLSEGKVFPEKGMPRDVFEFTVRCSGNIKPVVKRLYFNGGYKSMDPKGNAGTYGCLVSGYDLNVGNNQFHFYFSDINKVVARLPISGEFEGPVVEAEKPTLTPTATVTKTSTPEPTPTATEIQTPIPTRTPTPADNECLVITNPPEFFYNTIILSWTPIKNAFFYQYRLIINGEIYTFTKVGNNLMVTATNKEEWQQFVNLGTIEFQVEAYTIDQVSLEETEWTSFHCVSEDQKREKQLPTWTFVDGDCLAITNPTEFYYNTMIFSWTPVENAAYYQMLFVSRGWNLEFTHVVNTYAITIKNEEGWKEFVDLGFVYFQVAAYDINKKLISGSKWTEFRCQAIDDPTN